MATYADIKKANDEIKTTTLTRKNKRTGEEISKEYAEVNERIKAFRRVYPEGFVMTDLMSDENGVCVFKAEVGTYSDDGIRRLLGTGTAFERQDSSFINETSYIENCETSAVGRALGMAGFGIDTSIAFKEEVENAIANQDKKDTKPETKAERKATPKQVAVLANKYTGANLDKLLEVNGVESIEDLPMSKASELISKLKEAGK